MGVKICIIEDDEGIQDVLRIILKKAGYETTTFSDGRAIMENDYTTPDLFLVDKQLPVIDGLTICSHLRDNNSTRKVPVIIMSAYPNMRELAVLAGANDFIEKPFKVENLLDMIGKYIPQHVTEKIPVSQLVKDSLH
jgi:CheY-like chemotaxis protein